MTPDEFRDALDDLGFETLADFCKEVEAIGGERLPYRTVQDWTLGHRRISPLLPPLLALMRERRPKPKGRRAA
jgi:hypothetical protein